MAAGDRFVPLVYADVKALLEGEMGFTQRQPKATRELCWERQIVKQGDPRPYLVRVYSTLEPTGECRELGSDAIRVVLVDIEDPERERQLAVEKKVLRTKSAMTNLRERARDLYRYGVTPAHNCPTCGRLMQVRKQKGSKTPFFGCVGFAHNACKHTSSFVPPSATA